jgi:hypothetical protein
MQARPYCVPRASGGPAVLAVCSAVIRVDVAEERGGMLIMILMRVRWVEQYVSFLHVFHYPLVCYHKWVAGITAQEQGESNPSMVSRGVTQSPTVAHSRPPILYSLIGHTFWIYQVGLRGFCEHNPYLQSDNVMKLENCIM